MNYYKWNKTYNRLFDGFIQNYASLEKSLKTLVLSKVEFNNIEEENDYKRKMINLKIALKKIYENTKKVRCK